MYHRRECNPALQSPVFRPVRVYASPRQQQQQLKDGLEVLWSHVGAALTVVVPDSADEVFVDWV
jgi:hypothetical protein